MMFLRFCFFFKPRPSHMPLKTHVAAPSSTNSKRRTQPHQHEKVTLVRVRAQSSPGLALVPCASRGVHKRCRKKCWITHKEKLKQGTLSSYDQLGSILTRAVFQVYFSIFTKFRYLSVFSYWKIPKFRENTEKHSSLGLTLMKRIFFFRKSSIKWFALRARVLHYGYIASFTRLTASVYVGCARLHIS